MPTLRKRIKNAWNVFTSRDPTEQPVFHDYGISYGYRPDRIRLTRGNERSIVNAVYNRIAIDVASIDVKHVKTDENDVFIEEIDSFLNDVLQTEANIDQTGRNLMIDAVISLLDEGVIAIVPVDIDEDEETDSFDVLSLRVAKIIQWYPEHVKVRVYNEKTGYKQDIVINKRSVCVVENPFYSVMNEPNSTLQRLIRKLNLLDAIDEQTGSGKLDIIIQLPYVIKTEARKKQAEDRRKDIEAQLAGSKYGIAYTDGTERITQLNRPAENNLLTQIEYLTSMLYSQLGITEEVLNGTADEKTMLNYYNRTIEPIMSAIIDEMKRKLLTWNARKEGQSIKFFRNPFKLVPVTEMAELADKFEDDKNIIKECLGDDLILYMEWLVPHTVKYPEDRYHRAYVFDVYSISQERYLDTHIAYEIADKLGIPKVPIFYEGEFISYEHCKSFVGRTELGGEYGEGVVVKGNNKSLKFVGEKFAESHNHKVKEISIEELEAQAHRLQITEGIVTKARVHKILNKLVDENIIEQDWDEKSLGIISKHLPKLIFEDCMKEESETVKLVSDFGKLAAKTAMRLSREICEEKGECA